MKNYSNALSSILATLFACCFTSVPAANVTTALAIFDNQLKQLTTILEQQNPVVQLEAELVKRSGTIFLERFTPTLKKALFAIPEQDLPQYLKEIRDILEQKAKTEEQEPQVQTTKRDPRIKPIPGMQVFSIRTDKTAPITRPSKQNWDAMLKAIRGADTTAVAGLLPLFGYYPGGATTFGHETLMEILEKARGLTEGQKAPVRQLLNSLLFYDATQPFYEFTNFYQAPITIDGITWSCTEAFYQAQKFNWANKDAQAFYQNNFVAQAASLQPSAAFKMSKTAQAKPLIDPSWQKRSLDAMRQALEAKFAQSPDLKALLLSTGDLTLIEAAGKNDNFFGNGADGLGQNWLGRLLMELRAKLQKQ